MLILLLGLTMALTLIKKYKFQNFKCSLLRNRWSSIDTIQDYMNQWLGVHRYCLLSVLLSLKGQLNNNLC